MFAFALGCFGFIGQASARSWTGFDSDTGVSFVVDGPNLTAAITPGKHAAATRAELQGRNVRAACVSAYGDLGRLAGSGCHLIVVQAPEPERHRLSDLWALSDV